MDNTICNDHTERSDTKYIPFYHEKCPACGYCRYCGRSDSPFKDHWQPYEITWGGTSGIIQTESFPQAIIPSYIYSSAETYADVA